MPPLNSLSPELREEYQKEVEAENRRLAKKQQKAEARRKQEKEIASAQRAQKQQVLEVVPQRSESLRADDSEFGSEKTMKMEALRRYLPAIVIVLCVLAAIIAAAYLGPWLERRRIRETHREEWAKINHDNFETIKVGMTISDVYKILGSFGHETESNTYRRVFYHSDSLPSTDPNSEPWTRLIVIEYGEKSGGPKTGPPFTHVVGKEWWVSASKGSP